MKSYSVNDDWDTEIDAVTEFWGDGLSVEVDPDEAIGSLWREFSTATGTGLFGVWTGVTAHHGETLIYLGGNATSTTAELRLDVDGFAKCDLTIFGGVAAKNLSKTDVVINFTSGELAGVVGGAGDKNGAVKSVNLTIGGGDSPALVTAVYGGGFGAVNGDVTVNVLANATISNGIYGGARLILTEEMDFQTINGDVTLNLDHATFGGNIYGGSRVVGKTLLTGGAINGKVNLTIMGGTFIGVATDCIFAGGLVSGAVYNVRGVSLTIRDFKFDRSGGASNGVFAGCFACDDGMATIYSDVDVVVDNSTITGNLFGGGWAQGASNANIGAIGSSRDVKITVKNSCVTNIFGGGAHSSGSSGNTTTAGNIFISVTDSTIGLNTATGVDFGTIYARGQAENDIVSGDVHVTLAGATTVGKVTTKLIGDYDYTDDSRRTHCQTYLTLADFTGGVVDGVSGAIDRVTVGGESEGAISGAEKVKNWCFDLGGKTTDSAMLTWDSGSFADDTVELRLRSDNKLDAWTLVSLNPEGGVVPQNAFDNTSFALFIDNVKYSAEFGIGATIAGGAFDGYTLKYSDDTLTLGIA